MLAKKETTFVNDSALNYPYSIKNQYFTIYIKKMINKKTELTLG